MIYLHVISRDTKNLEFLYLIKSIIIKIIASALLLFVLICFVALYYVQCTLYIHCTLYTYTYTNLFYILYWYIAILAFKI